MSDQEPIERPWDKRKEPSPGGSSWLVANRKYVIAVVAVLAVVFLVVSNMSPGDEPVASSSGGSSSSSMSLSEAFCSDLKSGMTPMNILGEAVREGRYSPQQAADRAYGFASLSCPEQLQTNEALRLYLENWNINPDA